MEKFEQINERALVRKNGKKGLNNLTPKKVTNKYPTFNDWQQQSGQTMAAISKIVACSIGDNYA